MNLDVQNLKSLSEGVQEKHKNFVVSQVNEDCLRLAVNDGGIYPWHSHPNSDELFIVLQGELTVDFQDCESIILKPHDTLLIPSKTIHRTRAKGRTVNLCFEHADKDSPKDPSIRREQKFSFLICVNGKN